MGEPLPPVINSPTTKRGWSAKAAGTLAVLKNLAPSDFA